MMFISHFNKLIRNKLLWSGFASIVVLSFVVWGTQTGGSMDNAAVNQVGKLDGKPVDPEAYRQAYFNSYLSLALMYGQPLQTSAKLEDALTKMAWRRLIALRTGEAMNISTTPDEVVAAIQQQPYFSVDGQFRRERYDAFIKQFLSSLRASESQFEEHVRQEILIGKLRYGLAQTVWVAPLEVRYVFSQLYDTLSIAYVCLSHEDLESSVKVSEDEAEAFFKTHREDFRIPELRRVKYVEFPIESYLDEGAFDDKALRAYYEENIEKFSAKTGTNEWDNVKTFEEVEEDVRSRLAWETASAIANDKALDFEVALAPDRNGRAPTYEEAARAAGLTITRTAWFRAKQAVPGVEVGLDFNKAAFSLRATPDDYFSHPVRGESALYILALDGREDARLPEFAEVKGSVAQAARRSLVEQRAQDTLTVLRQSALDAIKNGGSFEAAAKPFGLEVVTPEPFSVKTGLEDEESDPLLTLVKSMLSLNAGEMTEVLLTKTGVALGVLRRRQPASEAVFESVKGDLAKYIRKRREELVFNNWEDALLKAARFEDLSPKTLARKYETLKSADEDPDRAASAED